MEDQCGPGSGDPMHKKWADSPLEGLENMTIQEGFKKGKEIDFLSILNLIGFTKKLENVQIKNITNTLKDTIQKEEKLTQS